MFKGVIIKLTKNVHKIVHSRPKSSSLKGLKMWGGQGQNVGRSGFCGI